MVDNKIDVEVITSEEDVLQMLGFSDVKLKAVLEPYFSIIEFREMKEIKDNRMFGKEFCWAVLLKKK